MVKRCVAAGVVALLACSTATAQTSGTETERIRMRQRISTMEAILERAVTNGADNVLRLISDVMSDRPMFTGAPQVTGFPLDGYGVVFHVQVPQIIMPIMWPLRQMVHDQTREAAATLQQLQTVVNGLQGEERVRIQRLIRDLEQQIGSTPGSAGPRASEARSVSAAAVVPAGPSQTVAVDQQRVVDDPERVYTREVKAALIDAMLENSQTFALASGDSLTIVARGVQPRNPLVPGDSIDTSTWVMRVRGSDLAAFRAGTITIEEARTKVEIREQ